MKSQSVVRSSVVTLALASTLATFSTLAAGPALAQENTLTGTQVACNENQLMDLLERMTVSHPAGVTNARSTTLFLTYSNMFGFYEGTVVSNQSPLVAANAGAAAPETLLAFHINPSVRRLLLNPTREPLDQVSLEREDTASNFVAPNSPNAVILALNPTLASNEEAGNARLQINNFLMPATGQTCNGFLSTSIRPGRGLTQLGLTTPCHTAFSALDRTVFALLQRMLRVQIGGAGGARDSEIAIYRGEEPQTYRIDIYPVAADGTTSLGRVALLLTVETDGAGAATGGQLALLDACTGGATSGCSDAAVPVQVFLFPPVFAGTQVRLSTAAAVTLNATPGATGAAPVDIDFGQLLAGTTWNG
jgi:hypothetical protein